MRSKFFIFILLLMGLLVSCSGDNSEKVKNDFTEKAQYASQALTKFLDGLDGIDDGQLFKKPIDTKHDPAVMEEIEEIGVAVQSKKAKIEATINQKTNQIAVQTVQKIKKGEQKTKQKIDLIIDEASQINGVDPKLVKAIIKVESEFDTNAISHKKAKGLMQLMPVNYRSLGIDPFDPEENIHAGTKILSDNLEEFNGNIRLALAAYNAGPTSIRKTNKVPKGGTKKYVEDVLEIYHDYKNQG